MFPASLVLAFKMNPLDRTRWHEHQCHLDLLDSSLDFALWPFVLDIFKSNRRWNKPRRTPQSACTRLLRFILGCTLLLLLLLLDENFFIPSWKVNCVCTELNSGVFVYWGIQRYNRRVLPLHVRLSSGSFQMLPSTRGHQSTFAPLDPSIRHLSHFFSFSTVKHQNSVLLVYYSATVNMPELLENGDDGSSARCYWIFTARTTTFPVAWW